MRAPTKFALGTEESEGLSGVGRADRPAGLGPGAEGEDRLFEAGRRIKLCSGHCGAMGRAGGEVTGVAVLLELAFLEGRPKLGDIGFRALLTV